VRRSWVVYVVPISAQVDEEDGVVVRTAHVLSRFIGQPIDRIRSWGLSKGWYVERHPINDVCSPHEQPTPRVD
jgi:hypothetical protein